MIRQNENSRNLKMIIFVTICIMMIAFSLAWYHALAGIDCALARSSHSNNVGLNSSGDKAHNCNEQLYFHWIKFFGINGVIYGAAVFVFVTRARKNNG